MGACPNNAFAVCKYQTLLLFCKRFLPFCTHTGTVGKNRMALMTYETAVSTSLVGQAGGAGDFCRVRMSAEHGRLSASEDYCTGGREFFVD